MRKFGTVAYLLQLLNFPIVIMPSEKILPARMNMELISRLQTDVAPGVFTPRAVYDGRKNMFTIRELPFGAEGSKEVILRCYP